MPNYSTSPNEFDDRRLEDSELADFRCESCEGRYPFDLLVIQEGHKVCKPNCAYDYTTSERDEIESEAKLEAAQLSADTAQQNAERIGKGNLYSLMAGISACTRIASNSIIYPDQIIIVAGGSSVPFTLIGIAFTSADSLTASHSGITFGAASISSDQTTRTTTVAASSAVPGGQYNFLFNGSRFPYAFRVR